MSRAAYILLALVLAAAGSIVVADTANVTDDWSPVMYPAQRLPLTFSHGNHLARGTACIACHPDVTSSRSAVDNLLPTEAQCRTCHPIDRAQPDLVIADQPPVSCVTCHPGYAPGVPVERTYLTPPPLKFSHAAHTSTNCAYCHGDLSNVDLATTRHLPTMQTCLGCHRDGAEQDQCRRCHLVKRGGLMQTQFAHGDLVPSHTGLGDAHGPNFSTDHRQEANQIGATCDACHDKSECVACHIGEVKPMDFHAGDYIRTHAVEARRGTPDCSACHRAASFCVACHERSGIASRTPTDYDQDDPDRAFHPPNWSSVTGGTPANQHAREARRNLTSCVSCHREEDCQRCHSAGFGGPSVSPHPANWVGSSRCKAIERSNPRVCAKCHITPISCDL